MPGPGGYQRLHGQKPCRRELGNRLRTGTAWTRACEGFCAASYECLRKGGGIQCPNIDWSENRNPVRPAAPRKNENRRAGQAWQGRGFQLSRILPAIQFLADSQSSKCALPSAISFSRSSSKSLCHCGTGMFFSSRRRFSQINSIARSFSSTVIWSNGSSTVMSQFNHLQSKRKTTF